MFGQKPFQPKPKLPQQNNNDCRIIKKKTARGVEMSISPSCTKEQIKALIGREEAQSRDISEE